MDAAHQTTELGREDLSLAGRYQRPSLRKSLWQLLSTFFIFGVLLWVMHRHHETAPWITFLVSVLAGATVLRIFVIQHDCGHGSFFVSRKLNDFVGCCCSLVTFVPYYYWRRQHALHHASNGNLDHRGHGDMDLLTVSEYLALPKIKRLRYRLYRNPVVFLLIGPLFFVGVINRFAFDKEKTSLRDRLNVYITNAVLAVALVLVGLGIGFVPLTKILLPTLYVAAAGGIWLFYVQHQFEHTYWRRDFEWDYVTAAMQGSSFYRLPKILQWITGSIGYHHIHHLKPGIPNYLLQRCHDENPRFQRVVTITLMESLKTMFLSLWDEKTERLISFGDFKRNYRLHA